MGRNQCSEQFCHLVIKLLPHYFLFILERQVLGGPWWKMPGPHQKFFSLSLLTKQHTFSFSLLFSLKTFPSSLKSTHPNIVSKNFGKHLASLFEISQIICLNFCCLIFKQISLTKNSRSYKIKLGKLLDLLVVLGE